MFNTIFVEKDLLGKDSTIAILAKYPQAKVKEINRYDDFFGRVKKPYLQKKDNLNLYLASKRGKLVKQAPEAYGSPGAPHFYFIHSYNCIYECQYCYLQGYFHSPDIVWFLNHDEITQEIAKQIDDHGSEKEIWFHAGEFSDSLALSHVTKELPYYFDLFSNYPNAKLELRTKSVNISELKKLQPLKNIIISYTLTSQKESKEIDLKTPSSELRLKAIKTLNDLGYKIGIHLDPIMFSENFEESYRELAEKIHLAVKDDQLEYISLGVVRFTKDVYRQMELNYPQSPLLAEEFVSSNGLMRYPRPLRMWLLHKVKEILVNAKIPASKIYFCMEK
jgi:spore photoproduct lyase